LSPHSPGTDQIETLLWIGFAAATIVIVAVNGALAYALRRRRGAGEAGGTGESSPGRGSQLRAGALLTAFAAAIFVVSIVYTGKARETPATGSAGLASASSKPLQVQATGQQWLWRYDYPNSAYSYYKLVVPVDTTVELDLVSTDVVHTWDVPQLAGKRDAVPGKTNHVVFRADEEGLYEGQSATFSGQAYAAMRTAVEVVSPAQYEDFLDSQKAGIQAAQDRVVGLIENGEVP
jgi:cytochrome c oxidase subunit 2